MACDHHRCPRNNKSDLIHIRKKKWRLQNCERGDYTLLCVALPAAVAVGLPHARTGRVVSIIAGHSRCRVFRHSLSLSPIA